MSMLKKSDDKKSDKPLSPNEQLQQLASQGEGIFSANDLRQLSHRVERLMLGTSVSTGPYEALTRIFTGQKMYVDTRDISVAPSLMMEGEWEMEITQIFKKFVKKDSVVIDVGANFGYFGVVAGQSIKAPGHIYFIEANPHLTPIISKSLSVNGLSELSTISNVAVGAQKGTLTLNILKDLWGSSSMHNKKELEGFMTTDFEIEEKITVDATTIDDYCKDNAMDRVDLIKIDVEGFEDQVFAGMKETIKKNDGLVVFLEFTEKAYDDAQHFFEQLADSFNRIQAIVGRTLRTVETYEELKTAMRHQWIMLVLSNERD